MSLEKLGHKVTLPNSFDNPNAEDEYRKIGASVHRKWKAGMIRHSEKVIGNNDAVLVLNFEKNEQANYIGGATFLEMYDAFRLKKKVFTYNPLPDNMLRDEIEGFMPVVIHGQLELIR